MIFRTAINGRHLIWAGIVWALASTAPAQAIPFQINATNISFTIPSPLFTESTVTGFLEISNSVAPGGSFGVPQLLNLSFDVAGYNYTLADFLPGFDVDGRISSDGNSIPFLQIGYDLSSSVPGCGGGCFGSINVAQSSSSNLLAVGDPNFTQYGLVEFDTAFTRVPEPVSISFFAAGLLGAGAIRRRQKAKAT
jgi:hypothetical protein